MAEKTTILKIVVSGFGEASRDLEFLTTETAKLGAEKKKMTAESTAAARAITAEEGSIEKLRAQTALLRQEANNMRAVTEKEIKTREQLTKVIFENTVKIRDYDRSISGSSTLVGEYERGIKAAFGNIQGHVNTVSGGFNQLAGAMGGVTAEVGNVVAGLATGGGAVALFTVLTAALASAWKRTQENIELYLKSADKLAAGPAAFERDSEKALEDAYKRARGQRALGLRIEEAASQKLFYFAQSFTEEEKKALQAEIESGKQMQENAKLVLSSKLNEVEKTKWKIQYNKLLQEEEKISDDKLAKETEWEKLEAELVKQRAIVSKQGVDEVEKKQAVIAAEIIANKLVADKTEFVDRQLDNINAIAEMTATQEVVEDKVNGLLKERNTIQKEYYSDQVKINRLEKSSIKTTGKEGRTWTEESLTDMGSDFLKYVAPRVAPDENPEVVSARLIQEAKDRIWEEGMAKARENYIKQRQDAQDNANEIVQIELDKLDQKQEIADAEIIIAAGIGDTIKLLADKNKALSLTALAIEKAAAIAQIISNVSVANAKAIATSPLTLGQPWVALNTGIGAISIANLVAQAAKSVGEISRFASGGRIFGGVRVTPDSRGDDTLIVAKQGEAILNESQQRRIGLSNLKRAGVPGFADGGVIGSLNYSPGLPFDIETFINRMVNGINDKQVILNVNKVNSAIAESNFINQSNKI